MPENRKLYLTFLERNEKSKKMFASVENWLTLTDNEDWRTHLLSVDMNQLVYRLAKSNSRDHWSVSEKCLAVE
ncbi:MAG: hypothetical protein U5K84_08625 [Alkalibacterium sp.]|nr:hypothetical protein [Alkalibacterium sp.]